MKRWLALLRRIGFSPSTGSAVIASRAIIGTYVVSEELIGTVES